MTRKGNKALATGRANPQSDDIEAPVADEDLQAEGAIEANGGSEGTEAGEDVEAGGADAENRRARRAAAARARKARLRERKEAEAVGLDAQEMLDDALVRGQDRAAKWFKKNWNAIQWTLVGGLAVWGAWGLYDLQQARGQAEASDVLADALRAEAGRVDSEGANPDEPAAAPDPTPVFATQAERLTAARTKFEAASQERSGSGTAAFAKLALAAVKLQQGELDQAVAEFDAVLALPLAKSYPELRGRALDGKAQALEAQGKRDEALKTYQELALVDGFKALAKMESVRLELVAGREAEAKVMLKELNEELGPPTSQPAQNYLEQAAKTYTTQLDPSAIQPAGITPEQLEQLRTQMMRSVQKSAPAGDAQKQADNSGAPAGPAGTAQ